MSGIRNAIPAGRTEKRALQASPCPVCSRCMFWCSTSGYLAVRWHNGRLPHNVFAGSWRCCSVKAVSAAESDIIDAEMPSLAAADHERSDRDNVNDFVQIMLRPVALAVCPDAAPPAVIQMLASPRPGFTQTCTLTGPTLSFGRKKMR